MGVCIRGILSVGSGGVVVVCEECHRVIEGQAVGVGDGSGDEWFICEGCAEAFVPGVLAAMAAACPICSEGGQHT